MSFIHHAKKRFGQHFLVDFSVLQNITKWINPQKNDSMVEIGPGQAALTRLLISKVGKLDLLELDRDLVAYLKQQFAQQIHVHIHNVDALKFDYAQLKQEKKIRIVGNLPYNISTPILFHLTQYADCILDQHFMLQKEVIDRMVASPGSKTYGRLSVMLQWRYQMTYLGDIEPSAFDPPPKVMSAFVRMQPLQNPLACSASMLERVVTLAFGQRRKMIRNSLSALCTEEELSALAVNPLQRAEDLSLADYVKIANALSA